MNTTEKQYQKQYRQDNLTIRRTKSRERYQNDSVFKFKTDARNSIYGYLKSNSDATNDLIGCSPKQLQTWIENQFMGKMVWHNHNLKRGWSINHKVGLRNAKTISQAKALCHWSNLEPIQNKENWRNKSKVSDKQLLTQYFGKN